MSKIIDRWSNHENPYGHGIICKTCMAKKYFENDISVRIVQTGTFIEVHSIQEDNIIFCIVGNDTQVEEDQLICSKADVIYVPDNLWGPLFTVKQNARLSLLEDCKVAESLGNISVGHTVQVLGPDNKVVCTGCVTFKNGIAKLGVGVYFGLKIESCREDLAGNIRNLSLLEPGTKGFPRDCDIVVAVDQIRPNNSSYIKEKSLNSNVKEHQKQSLKTFNGEGVNNTSYKSMIVDNLKDRLTNNSKKCQSINSVKTENNLNISAVKKSINTDNPLMEGDEVVYLHGKKLEKGIVRWMGFTKNKLLAAVEFDNPVGNGTGSVDGIELFKAKPFHTLIIPPKELIKLSDYMMNTTNEMIQYKNNNNINNNNNNNCNNNNNNNNNNYNSVKSIDVCCDNKSVEEKCKMVKSNSLQCLKHQDRTFYGEDPYQINHEDLFKGKQLYASSKGEKMCEQQFQFNSKRFDVANPNDRKILYRKQFNSVDNDFLTSKESKMHNGTTNTLCQRTSSQDLCVLAGSDMSEQCRSYNNYAGNKFKKDMDDDVFCSYKTVCNKVNEEHIIHHEKGICDSQCTENFNHSENIENYYDTPKLTTSYTPEDLGKGSVVELIFKGEPHYGVIRWIGIIPEDRGNDPPRLTAGIEMEEEANGLTDGTFNNKRYFQCNPNKALFVSLSKCRKDSRFLDESHKQNLSSKINYGQIDCPLVEGTVPPIYPRGGVESVCGKNRGIQGHHNSCYLDATLFSMFAFTCVFDSLLYRPPTKHDIPQYTEVQRVLREEIVNPLRKNLYVRADRVMKLRTLLDKLSSVSGLTSEEKDPEEFLNSLLTQILKAEPFLKLSSGQEAFHYQLFVEKDERLTCPSVQQLFEQSFVTSDIKLKEVPPCLIIQMPRFGKSFKMYSRILPPQLLDVTDIIENSPRQCTVCGKSAEYECKDCFGQHGIGNGLESISFCRTCLETAHNHHCRMRHNYKSLTVPVEFAELQEHCIIPRLYMELFAVVCIETSHYVAFVKCGSGSDAPWCFFDSMADRKGEQNGYNIPEMVPCPDLPYWLSEEGAKMLSEMRDERQLPEHAKRLFSDAYMCMYQSPDMMMYR